MYATKRNYPIGIITSKIRFRCNKRFNTSPNFGHFYYLYDVIPFRPIPKLKMPSENWKRVHRSKRACFVFFHFGGREYVTDDCWGSVWSCMTVRVKFAVRTSLFVNFVYDGYNCFSFINLKFKILQLVSMVSWFIKIIIFTSFKIFLKTSELWINVQRRRIFFFDEDVRVLSIILFMAKYLIQNVAENKWNSQFTRWTYFLPYLPIYSFHSLK